MNQDSSSWRRLPDQSYERHLGTLESAFYWTSLFSRTADMIRCSQIKVIAGNVDETIGLLNVARAWTNVKLRYPLLGSRLTEHDNDIFLNVAQDRLLTYQPNEISFHGISSHSEAVRLADSMLETDHLSNDLLARIVIARDQSRTDSFYFLFAVSHVIADGVACMTIIKNFVNELCGNSLNQPTLEERLPFAVSYEQLNPAVRLNKTRRRWRSTVAAIIANRRIAKLKGGHSLPQKVSEKTRFTPARTVHRNVALSPEMSMRIVQNCRNKGITFGNAYPIIGQVAAARLLLKRYLQGEIDEDEWEFRKKEPMYSAGPVNLRPLLDCERLANGGIDHVGAAIGFYFYPISFLPLGQAAKLQPGMTLPEVGNLLTRERFFYRARMVQKQAKVIIGNPLFLEIGVDAIRRQRRIESARDIALQGKATTGSRALSDRVMTPMEQAAGLVWCNGGSSIGNMDKLIPLEYPIKSESPVKVRLQLGEVFFRLRCRPGELYLGAVTMQKQLVPFIHFDSNVFDDTVAEGWLNEVKMALEFYLGEKDM